MNTIEAILNTADQYVDQGLWDKAVAEYERILEQEPNHVEALLCIGQIAIALDQKEEAGLFFFRALIAMLDLVDCLAENDELEVAAELLLQAEEYFPEEPSVFAKQAAIYMKMGDVLSVIGALKRQVLCDPSDLNGFASLIAFAFSANDVQTAATAIELMIEEHPESWQGYHYKALLLDMGDRPELAIRALRKAHQLAPKAWQPLNDLGDLLNSKSQIYPEVAQEAVDVLTAACLLAPAHEFAPRYNLALAYWNAGFQERAMQALKLLVQNHSKEHPIVQQAAEMLTCFSTSKVASKKF